MRGQMKGITPFDTWRYVTTITKHFTTGYDCVKYHFKMKSLTPSAFAKRRDQYFFSKLSKEFTDENQLIMYCVANAMEGNTWVGKMTREPYDQLVRRLQSFSYQFQTDMKTLKKEDANFDNWLVPSVNFSPKIIGKMLAGDINIESVIAIDAMTGFLDIADREVQDPLVWDEAYAMLKNYRAFVVKWVNIETARKNCINIFTS